MPSELEIARRFRDEFSFYAPRALRIRTKTGSVDKFKLNKAQEYLHGIAERQRKETGRVRIIVLKGRQQGISTYIEGRYYWRVTHRKGVQAFILTHEQAATDNLFKMVARYHEHCPSVLKPQTDASSAKELVFGRLDSGYKLGTAGSRGTGRSSTIQFFHGSEVAFWPHADEHASGVMQAIPDQPNTEVFLESTANGLGNYFHRMWQSAEAKQSEYEAVFIPWFWQPEYRRSADGFRPTDEEAEYARLYGVDMEQLAWLRAKVAEFNGDMGLFNQEYPATPALAFQFSKQDSFITAEPIQEARKCNMDSQGAVVAGLDPARFGDDRTALVIRRGRKVIHTQTWSGKDTMEVVGLAIKAKEEHSIDMMFIDVGGLGAGVVDRLKELGHRTWTRPVNSGEKPTDGKKYFNKRAEMWALMKEWLIEPPVSIPDSDELQADLMAPSYTYDSHTRLKMEKKEDIKKRGMRSPDLGDALALTFAYPVVKDRPKVPNTYRQVHGQHGWMGM